MNNDCTTCAHFDSYNTLQCDLKDVPDDEFPVKGCKDYREENSNKCPKCGQEIIKED